MTPESARRIASTGRRLLTARLIRPADYAVLDALLWRVRKPGRWDCDPDYATIARLAGICRSRAIEAVRRLVALGILTKRRRHVLVRWGSNRAQVAARQVSNSYTFCVCVSKESSPRSADSDSLIDRGSKALEAALSGLGSAIQCFSTQSAQASKHSANSRATVASP